MENVEKQALSNALDAPSRNAVQNDAGTACPIDAPLTQARSLSVPEIRRHLAGRRLTCAPVIRPYISNLITQVPNFATADPERKARLRIDIEANIRRIEAALAAHLQ